MTEADLIDAVRDAYAGARSNTPIETIARRGGAIRVRRRAFSAATALGMAAAAAAAVTVALVRAPGHAVPPSTGVGTPRIQLADWTVARRSDGSIGITFREAADAAGLQHALRAAGVPVSVTFTGHRNPACHGIAGPLPRVVALSYRHPSLRYVYQHPNAAHAFHPAAQSRAVFSSRDALTIRPAALPHGDGLQIWVSGTPGAADDFKLSVRLVSATPGCTG